MPAPESGFRRQKYSSKGAPSQFADQAVAVELLSRLRPGRGTMQQIGVRFEKVMNAEKATQRTLEPREPAAERVAIDLLAGFPSLVIFLIRQVQNEGLIARPFRMLGKERPGVSAFSLPQKIQRGPLRKIGSGSARRRLRNRIAGDRTGSPRFIDAPRRKFLNDSAHRSLVEPELPGDFLLGITVPQSDQDLPVMRRLFAQEAIPFFAGDRHLGGRGFARDEISRRAVDLVVQRTLAVDVVFLCLQPLANHLDDFVAGEAHKKCDQRLGLIESISVQGQCEKGRPNGLDEVGGIEFGTEAPVQLPPHNAQNVGAVALHEFSRRSLRPRTDAHHQPSDLHL